MATVKATLSNQKIYFICGGTSTNDVIKSINNNIVNEKKSIYDIFFSKKENKKDIPEDEFSQLDELGIKEMYMCLKNSQIEDIFIKLYTRPDLFAFPPNIYTSLNYSCIESSSILFHKVTYLEITPLPNISNNSNIKDKKTFDRFKKKFGHYHINNHIPLRLIEVTNMDNYWNRKANEINNDYLNIKSAKGFINWKETYKKDILSLFRYSYYKFKKQFEYKCTEKYNIATDINNPINGCIFISDSMLIIDILKEVKSIRYKKNEDIVERSSVWEIDIDIDFEYDTRNNITKKTIKYKRYTKIYPTENNYKPLKYNNGNYEYKYNNFTYKLFNSLNDIPLNYIKNLYFYRYPKNKLSSIKKILTKDNKKNNIDNIKNNNSNGNKKIINKITFENLK